MLCGCCFVDFLESWQCYSGFKRRGKLLGVMLYLNLDYLVIQWYMWFIFTSFMVRYFRIVLMSLIGLLPRSFLNAAVFSYSDLIGTWQMVPKFTILCICWVVVVKKTTYSNEKLGIGPTACSQYNIPPTIPRYVTIDHGVSSGRSNKVVNCSYWCAFWTVC